MIARPKIICYSGPHMAKKVTAPSTEAPEVILRVYEAGYQIAASVKENEVEAVVAAIRGVIEKAGGAFIAEGAPSLMRLAYDMETRQGEKYTTHDKAYFGWLKFETTPIAAEDLAVSFKANPLIVRSIVFRTSREETRAKIKAPQLREIKRTDTLKSSARKEEAAAPVSEAELDKALEVITE